MAQTFSSEAKLREIIEKPKKFLPWLEIYINQCLTVITSTTLQFAGAVMVKDVAAQEVLDSFSGAVKSHGVVNGSPPLQRFFGAVLPRN